MIPPLIDRVLEIAGREVGIRELGRNRGPRVDQYVEAAGLDPTEGHPWCVAFLRWVFVQAGGAEVFPRTASVHKLWRLAPEWRRDARPFPGHVFLIDHGAGTGHAGLVEAVTGTHCVTVEGNTSEGGSREGDGVRRRMRRFHEVNMGWLDFGREPPGVA